MFRLSLRVWRCVFLVVGLYSFFLGVVLGRGVRVYFEIWEMFFGGWSVVMG